MRSRDFERISGALAAKLVRLMVCSPDYVEHGFMHLYTRMDAIEVQESVHQMACTASSVSIER